MKVETVTIEIKGQKVTLTLDEMRELRDIVDDVLGDDGDPSDLCPPIYVPVPCPVTPTAPTYPAYPIYPYYPTWPSYPIVTYCFYYGDTANSLP